MRRVLLALTLASALGAQTLTTVTGTLKDLAGNVVQNGQVTFDLRPGIDTTQSGQARFVPLTITCQIVGGAISSIARSSNVVTATLSAAPSPNFFVGATVEVEGVADAGFDGNFTLTSVSGATLTWAQTAANATSSGGTAANLYNSPAGGTPNGACTVTYNTSLTPQGTYYLVTEWPDFVSGAQFNWYATASTQDISTVVPTPATSPAYTFVDTQSAQSIGGAKTFTGSVTAGAASVNGVLSATAAPYSAYCDGNHDDSVALAQWLAAAVAAGAGVVPAGAVCKFATPLSVGTGASANSHFTLYILGELEYTGTTAAPVLWIRGTPGSADNYDIHIVGAHIVGDASSTYDFECDSCHRSTFSDLWLGDTVTAGAYFKYGEGDRINGLLISPYPEGGTWPVQQPADGIVFDQYSGSGNQLNTSTITGLQVQDVSNVGEWLKASSEIETLSPELQASTVNYEVDYDGAPSSNNTLVGGTLEVAPTAVLDNGYGSGYAGVDANGKEEFGTSSRNAWVLGGNADAVQVDGNGTPTGSALNTCLMGIALGATVTDDGYNTETSTCSPVFANGLAAVPVWRQMVPAFGTVSGYNASAQDLLRGYFQISPTAAALSATVLADHGSRFRLWLAGAWTDDADSNSEEQPGGWVEVTDAAPTVQVGTEVVTFSLSPAHQLQAAVTTGSADVYFSGTLLVEAVGAAGASDGPALRLASELRMASGAPFDFNGDAGISRDSADALDFGNGAPGDKTGTLNAAHLNLGGAAVAQGAASLTTTAAATDTATVSWDDGASRTPGHCSLTPTNSSAASNIATTYISAKSSNQVTVTHTATSGMTYDITCTPN